MLSASTLESEEVALLLDYVLGDGLPVQAVKMHRTIPMESVLMNTSFIRNQPILSLRYAYDTSGEQTIMPAFQIHRSGDGNSHAHDLVWYAAERDGVRWAGSR